MCEINGSGYAGHELFIREIKNKADNSENGDQRLLTITLGQIPFSE